MTNSQLGAYLRWKGNINSSTPWDDTSLLPIVNIAKDNITQAIVQENPDYFGEVSTTATVSSQQEYTKPSDLLLMKRIDVSYTDTNPGSFRPTKKITLNDISDLGEDWYANYQDPNRPMVRFDDTGFFLYPEPGLNGTSVGNAFIRLWYVPKRTDIADLSTSTDVETTTGIGSMFHELIGDIVVNQIKFKKGELTQQDLNELNQHILDILVPAAFRQLSTTQSYLPSDTNLQY